ncbi:MAG: NUDIX domain-containing protein [Acholeplasmataceae bacterium]|jgi:8-oxo-dGTP pyrophosphatase MutT (NUDIX family)|nr:NUDIX domain-containing protein [Acholeplasmataceae bacterium]
MDYNKQMYLNLLISKKQLDLIIYDLKLDYDLAFETRHVVRGICLKDDKILVVHPKDELIYGIPGGGIEGDESHLQALEREMHEEVGAKSIKIISYMGQMVTYRKKFDTDTNFKPIHYLYIVDILEQGDQHLIDYEQNIGLNYIYIPIDEVIKRNEIALKHRDQAYLDFYTNQTVLFKIIKDYYMND